MKQKLHLIAILNSAILVAGCQSTPAYVVKDLPARPKPPAPQALSKPLPPPGYFQEELEVIFKSLSDPSIYLNE